ncbi:hypothetical protein EV122DRAFT_250202 [Schizophyllum commune]
MLKKRGRPPKPPLPGFIEISKDRVRCVACSEFGIAELARSGPTSHLETSKHEESVRLLERRQQEQQERAERLSRLYTSRQQPNPEYTPAAATPRPSMFAHPATGADPPSSDAPDATVDFTWRPATIVPDCGMDIDPPFDVAAERERLDRIAALLREQARHDAEFGAPEEEEEEEEDVDQLHESDKIAMLLDIVDNLPRLRMSSSQFHIILWLLKECGVPNVPSYDKFREIQQDVAKRCGVSRTEEHVSILGNRFFTNNIAQSIALDFSNPEIAKHLHFYPEDVGDCAISEVWQADRWKEFRSDELTPMFARGAKRFFVDEVCQLDDDSYVIPRLWVMRQGVLCADCSNVDVTPHGWTISGDIRSVKSKHFIYNFDDVLRSSSHYFADADAPDMPNPLRQLAPDCDIYVVMAPIWADDVSGNRSKQYNKHMNMYMANSNIPGRLLQQEYFVRFVSTSPNASSPEQFAAVRDQINATHSKPIRCFNADTRRECAVIVRCPALPADNPQQSEEASHIGGNGNCSCRKCKVGGPQVYRQSDEGYHALHLVGIARSASEIKEEIKRQIDAATRGVKERVTEMQTASGTKDKVAQHWIDILLEKAKAMKKGNRTVEDVSRELHAWLAQQPGDKMNPLLSIAGLDPSQDTPVEILHTILLGIVKYAWHILHTSWSEDERNLFTVRLQSTDIDGLTIAPIRAAYMMQYRNNLIGKDFKKLMQTAPFHAHGITDATEKHPDRFPLVKAVGELGAALWVHKIENLPEYLADLEILVANVLDAFDAVDCKKIVYKIKLHLLPHLIDDIRRFGPAIRNSTEVFEGFNAVFRLCSVLSNHQAPSRDIASKFASLDPANALSYSGLKSHDAVVEPGKCRAPSR